MPRLVWITDPHFNFISGKEFYEFMERIAAEQPDALLVGGDIGEAPDVTLFLQMMEEALECPICFVLGNHDFYRGSISATRQRIRELCRRNPHLVWLNDASSISLSAQTALVGHDGWADGRLGDYAGSTVMLNDYLLIDELAGLDKSQRLAALNRLGDEAAAHVNTVLPAALANHDQVILLTHVPPFREACWHEGQISGEDWLPHMTCHAVGETIKQVMARFPQKRLTVLCGHTHSGGETHVADNIHVITGAAVYGAPALGRVWDVK